MSKRKQESNLTFKIKEEPLDESDIEWQENWSQSHEISGRKRPYFTQGGGFQDDAHTIGLVRGDVKIVRFERYPKTSEKPRNPEFRSSSPLTITLSDQRDMPSTSQGQLYERKVFQEHERDQTMLRTRFQRTLKMDTYDRDTDRLDQRPEEQNANPDSDCEIIAIIPNQVGTRAKENGVAGNGKSKRSRDLEKMKIYEDRARTLRDAALRHGKILDELQGRVDDMNCMWKNTIEIMESATMWLAMNTHRMEKLKEQSDAVLKRYDEEEETSAMPEF